jgi:hypothetical protein
VLTPLLLEDTRGSGSNSTCATLYTSKCGQATLSRSSSTSWGVCGPSGETDQGQRS